MTNEQEKTFNIAIAGLGTVGCGLIRLIEKNKDIIEFRTGKKIKILAVSAKSKEKKRAINLENIAWVSDPMEFTNFDQVHCVVELIGGHEGIAKDLVFQSINKGKNVVTANKALLAHHGHEIAVLAEEKKVNVYYEAAVAGGIPIIRTLMQSLSPNKTSQIIGVINGTCNYILTEMEKNSLSYETAFNKAKGLGYVEADPELDIGGIDSAHKLAILSSIGFNQKTSLEDINTNGIKDISLFDIKSAKELGFKIKLLASAKVTEHGFHHEVAPCLIPLTSPIAQVMGSENIILVESDFIGKTYYRGAGAGEGPTASAVMADLINISGDKVKPLFGIPEQQLQTIEHSIREFENSFYIRINIRDEPGALSHITGILGEYGISINRMRQKDHKGLEAPIVLLTHKTSAEKIRACIEQLSKDDICIGLPVCLRIEDI